MGWGILAEIGDGVVEADLGEVFFEFGAVGFEPGGELDACGEVGGGLVDGEAGVVGGDFEECAAGFAEVDGVEVVAVHDGGDVVAAGLEGFEPGGLIGVIGGAEGDVVDLADAHARGDGFGDFEDVDDLGGAVVVADEAGAVVFACGLAECEEIDEDAGGRGGGDFSEGDAVEAADLVFARNPAVGPEMGVIGGGFNEGEREAVGVGEGEDVVIEALGGLGGDVVLL